MLHQGAKGVKFVFAIAGLLQVLLLSSSQSVAKVHRAEENLIFPTQTPSQNFFDLFPTDPQPSQQDQKCHSEPDGSNYHCHEAVEPIPGLIRDPEREQTAQQAEPPPINKCQAWQSPMRGEHRITDCVGSSRGGGRQHAGLDFGNGQQPNTKIFAAGPGKVIQAGFQNGYGCVIQVQHEECPAPLVPYSLVRNDKCVSFYAHLENRGGSCPMTNRIGSTVTSCDNIAIMGGTGGNYPKHLHFEIRLRNKSEVRINPLVALGREVRKAASNPGQCSGTNTWLAVNRQGQKSHSTDSNTREARNSGAQR